MRETIKTYSQHFFLNKEYPLVCITLILATYLLTPRFFEIGSESFPSWAAARILRETGGFPVMSLGPAYVVYLLFFQIFDFPTAVRIEFYITHMFCYLSIYLMLKNILQRRIALLLTLAWIPHISVVVSTRYVAGMACLAMYFREKKIDCDSNQKFFPIWLVIATLCHLGYLPFLIGHVFGTIIERLKTRRSFVKLSFLSFQALSLARLFQLVFQILLLLPFLSSFQMNRMYY